MSREFLDESRMSEGSVRELAETVKLGDFKGLSRALIINIMPTTAASATYPFPYLTRGLDGIVKISYPGALGAPVHIYEIVTSYLWVSARRAFVLGFEDGVITVVRGKAPFVRSDSSVFWT